MIVNEKIGMYTEDEILEQLTEGEGRSFLGRSMYDAIFDKIHALKTENEQLQQENARLKEMLIQNGAKQKMLLEDINKYAIGVIDNYLKENQSIIKNIKMNEKIII